MRQRWMLFPLEHVLLFLVDAGSPLAMGKDYVLCCVYYFLAGDGADRLSISRLFFFLSLTACVLGKEAEE